MKKNVAVISLDAYAGQFYAQQVQELFGDRIAVCSYSVRDGSVEHNGLRNAASWDARRAAPMGVRGPQPPAHFGNFSAVKSSPPEAGERLPMRTGRPGCGDR